MKRFTTRKTAQLGLLFALAMGLSFLEMQITPLLGLAPGVKPGLANVVVMYSMVSMGAFSGLVLTLLKAGFVLMVQGPMAAVLSLCGGLCALGAMVLVHKLKGTDFMLAVAGAVLHNAGQLAALSFLFIQSGYTFYYAPVLLISGLCMGTLTSWLLKHMRTRMKKWDS